MSLYIFILFSYISLISVRRLLLMVHIELRFLICGLEEVDEVEELRLENESMRWFLINVRGRGVFVNIELSFCICVLDDIESMMALFMMMLD